MILLSRTLKHLTDTKPLNRSVEEAKALESNHFWIAHCYVFFISTVLVTPDPILVGLETTCTFSYPISQPIRMNWLW